MPDLSHDEAFVVWMQAVAPPTFLKLAMKNEYASVLAVRYQIDTEDGRFHSGGGEATHSLTRVQTWR